MRMSVFGQLKRNVNFMNGNSVTKDEDKTPLIDKVAMEDPFFVVRENVRNQSDKIKIKYAKFQELVKNSDTSSNPEFKELRRSLIKDVRTFEGDLRGLAEAVDTIEKDRKKFLAIKDADLASRKKFVSDMQIFIQDIKKGYDSQLVRQKMDEDSNRAKRAAANPENPAMARNKELDDENNRFVKDQKLRTKEIITQQDENLAVLGQSIDRLGQTGRVINQELKEQEVLLDGLEKDIDHASNRMTVVMEALQKLLKTKDGCQIWTIVILALILIILVALVIWT